MGRPILLASPHLRKEYALRHHGLAPTVQLNDVAMRNEQKRFLLSGATMANLLAISTSARMTKSHLFVRLLSPFLQYKLTLATGPL